VELLGSAAAAISLTAIRGALLRRFPAEQVDALLAESAAEFAQSLVGDSVESEVFPGVVGNLLSAVEILEALERKKEEERIEREIEEKEQEEEELARIRREGQSFLFQASDESESATVPISHDHLLQEAQEQERTEIHEAETDQKRAAGVSEALINNIVKANTDSNGNVNEGAVVAEVFAKVGGKGPKARSDRAESAGRALSVAARTEQQGGGMKM
jgi:hypothetical protein